MELTITIKLNDEELVNLKDAIKIEKEEPTREGSIYARFFDEGSPMWCKDAEMNLMFLKNQENYANDKLKAKGHLFLNEVYDMLGLPRTKSGAVVGWLYKEENPIGDNHVDFDIYNDRNHDFVNGYERTALLDFNVDGMILDYI